MEHDCARVFRGLRAGGLEGGRAHGLRLERRLPHVLISLLLGVLQVLGALVEAELARAGRPRGVEGLEVLALVLDLLAVRVRVRALTLTLSLSLSLSLTLTPTLTLTLTLTKSLTSSRAGMIGSSVMLFGPATRPDLPTVGRGSRPGPELFGPGSG